MPSLFQYAQHCQSPELFVEFVEAEFRGAAGFGGCRVDRTADRVSPLTASSRDARATSGEIGGPGSL